MINRQIPVADRLLGVEEYYFSKKLQEINELNRNGERVINLGIGSPDLAPPENVIKALIASAENPQNHRYQEYRGITELRNAFAAWYHKYFNVHLDPEREILPLMGSKEGIMHITMAFVNKGDVVLVPNPGYPTYAAAANLAGGTVKAYDLSDENGWLPDLNILDKTDLSKVKLMWINYPHMPTGAIANREDLRNLISFAYNNNIILVNDNPYAFILNKTPLSLLENRTGEDHIVELNSLSKSHNMSGWRVGVVAGNSQLIERILQFKSNMDSGMFLPIQVAAIRALEERMDWYEKQNQTYAKRSVFARKIATLLNCSYTKDTSGIFIWAKIPVEWDSSEALSDIILQHARVFITPGHIFGSQGRRYIRLSLCSPTEDWQVALKRISGIKNEIKYQNEKEHEIINYKFI